MKRGHVVACAVVVAAAAVFSFAVWQGREDDRRLQEALQLTGGAVGMTRGQIYQLGDKLAAEGFGTIGDAREVLFWIVCSARFTGAAAEAAARAALRLVEVQRLSPQEAVGRLAPMAGAGDPFTACPR